MVDGMIEGEKTSSSRAWRSACSCDPPGAVTIAVSTGVEVYPGTNGGPNRERSLLHMRGGACYFFAALTIAWRFFLASR